MRKLTFVLSVLVASVVFLPVPLAAGASASMSPRVCDRNDGYFIWHVLTSKYVSCDAAISNGDNAFNLCAEKIWDRNVTSANCGSRGYACRMTTGPSVGGGQLVHCYKDARHWFRFKMSGDRSMVNIPEVTTCITDKTITGAKRVRLRTTFLRERIQLDACALPGGKVAFRMSLPSKRLLLAAFGNSTCLQSPSRMASSERVAVLWHGRAGGSHRWDSCEPRHFVERGPDNFARTPRQVLTSAARRLVRSGKRRTGRLAVLSKDSSLLVDVGKVNGGAFAF